jgi:hypothetical protein
MRFRLPVIVLLTLPSLAAAQPDFATDIRPLIDKFCIDCHGPKKQRGGLNFDGFKSAADAAKNPELWAEVAGRLRTNEMPPDGSRRPSNQDRRRFAVWAEGVAKTAKPEADCDTLATDRTVNFYRGHVMSRRLTRAEYDNTIRDLIGLDLKPSRLFPSDGAGGEGFDTVGDALFTSAIHVERYMAAADQILDAALSPGSPAARKRVLVAEPGPDVIPREAAHRVIRAFATRAYRRPLTGEEIDRLLGLFDKAAARGDPFETAIRLPLKAVLINPNFLFLVEPEPEKEGVYPLGGYPLAARLSYFLWASMPDEELFRLAAEGKLTDDGVLKQQVRRMLRDPKAKGFAENFALQWLNLRALGGSARPDPNKFPEFTDELAEDMRQEVVLFFAHVLREDRSLLELIDADYTFANDRLAKLYGIPGVSGPELRKVPLPDRTRGGVLGMGATLTATSYPLRTSPVLRGRWVLEDVLGARVPPPPPNVPELEKDDAKPGGLTVRQQLELHRKNPECASCHARMDPLGFGLENFDAIGRWRTEVNGARVDSTGELPDGTKFDGPQELKQLLLKRKPEFLRNLSRKVLGYALGRQLYPHDQCVIDDALKALEAEGYRSHVLIERIVLSYPFRHRYVKK